jgi:hypothetical protein
MYRQDRLNEDTSAHLAEALNGGFMTHDTLANRIEDLIIREINRAISDELQDEVFVAFFLKHLSDQVIASLCRGMMNEKSDCHHYEAVVAAINGERFKELIREDVGKALSRATTTCCVRDYGLLLTGFGSRLSKP